MTEHSETISEGDLFEFKNNIQKLLYKSYGVLKVFNHENKILLGFEYTPEYSDLLHSQTWPWRAVNNSDIVVCCKEHNITDKKSISRISIITRCLPDEQQDEIKRQATETGVVQGMIFADSKLEPFWMSIVEVNYTLKKVR